MLVVPSSDAHCLTQPPPAIPAVMDELAALAKDATATRVQLDELGEYAADATDYMQRAWKLCGTVKK